jgi:hypothetical protein
MAELPIPLSAVAAMISKNTRIIESYLQENMLPRLSFYPDGPKIFPADDKHPDILHARNELIDLTQELRQLVMGPTDTIKERIMVVSAWCSY